MAIDDCLHTFSELGSKILPEHMKRLKEALSTPIPMAEFGRKGDGPKSLLARLNRESDFVGCYVLLENSNPVYVGISRTVIQRLLQHVKGRTHSDASLAYQIASHRYDHDLARDAAMNDPTFRQEFINAKEYIKSLSVAFIEIENDVELYLFEVCCAMELDTSRWNSFRTH